MEKKFMMNRHFEFFFITFFAFMMSVKAEEISTEERLEKLENEILELKLIHENQSMLSISGDFSTLYQNTNYTKPSANLSNENYDLILSELQLNVDKTDNEKIKFYSTFNASYIWNSTLQSPSVILDNGQSNLRGSYLYLDKIYFDYFFPNKSYSFSLGRLPTQFGPPQHFATNSERQGTYPILLYSLPIDGIAFTANIGNLFNLNQRYIGRIVYSPSYNRDVVNGPNATGRNNGMNSLETINGNTLHVNFETSGVNKLGKYNVILQGYDALFGRAKSLQGVRGVLESGLPTGSIDNNVYEIGSNDKYLARMQAVILYGDVESLFKTPFDLYASFKKTDYRKLGNLDAITTQDNSGGALGPVGTVTDIGGFIYSDDKLSGDSYFLGTRYGLSDSLNIGVEYINQTYGNASTTLRSERYLDFYNVIGKAYHLYINYLVDTDFSMALGYINSHVDSDFAGFSFVKDDKAKISQVYSQIRVRF